MHRKAHRSRLDKALSAWFLVAIGFAALAVSFSVRAVFGLAMPLIEAQLHWSYSFLSGVGACALIVMSVAAPLAGRAMDLHGPRALFSGGLMLIAIGTALVSLSTSRILFVIGFAIVAAIGFALVSLSVLAAAIVQRFDSRRGLATGLGSAGATAGQLIVVPCVALLMRAGDWVPGFSALAMASGVLAIACWWLLPGADSSIVKAPAGPAARKPSIRASTAFLVRQPVFHVLFWSFLLCGFTTTGAIETHLLPYAAFCGFPPLPSGTAYGVLSAVNMGGMIMAGALADRVDRPTLLGAIYIARAATFVLLNYIAPDVEMLYLFAVLFGLFDYATVPVTVSLATSHLGVERVGLAMGLISGGHALGGALGALAGGVSFDRTGGYAMLWWVSMALAVLAGLVVFMLRAVTLHPFPSGNRRGGDTIA